MVLGGPDRRGVVGAGGQPRTVLPGCTDSTAARAASAAASSARCVERNFCPPSTTSPTAVSMASTATTSISDTEPS
jgi:hypothetical protein